MFLLMIDAHSKWLEVHDKFLLICNYHFFVEKVVCYSGHKDELNQKGQKKRTTGGMCKCGSTTHLHTNHSDCL